MLGDFPRWYQKNLQGRSRASGIGYRQHHFTGDTYTMKHQDLIAIDIHTHAEVSCWNPFDNYGEEYDRAADKFFGSNRRPTIDETVAYYREKKIGLVMFTVDSESQLLSLIHI
jgi:hypothetical protein